MADLSLRNPRAEKVGEFNAANCNWRGHLTDPPPRHRTALQPIMTLFEPHLSTRVCAKLGVLARSTAGGDNCNGGT